MDGFLDDARARWMNGWLSVVLLTLMVGCGEDSGREDTNLDLFKKNVTLEQQLSTLADIGLVVNQGVVEEDLISFDTRAILESKPYRGLVEVMGIELEREPYAPICDRLWMCDYERIEDHGDYRDVILRLELMTGVVLALTNVTDYVDVEEEKAWVEFDFRGRPIHWDFVVENDWLDPAVLVKYDRLLKGAQSPLRIYSNHSDYGQVAFLGAFTPEEKSRFDRLTKIKLILIEKQV